MIESDEVPDELLDLFREKLPNNPDVLFWDDSVKYALAAVLTQWEATWRQQHFAQLTKTE